MIAFVIHSMLSDTPDPVKLLTSLKNLNYIDIILIDQYFFIIYFTAYFLTKDFMWSSLRASLTFSGSIANSLSILFIKKSTGKLLVCMAKKKKKFTFQPINKFDI